MSRPSSPRLQALCWLLVAVAGNVLPASAADRPLAARIPPRFDLTLLASQPVQRPLEQGGLELLRDPSDGHQAFLVRQQQAGIRIDEPAFVTPGTTLEWSWRKDAGHVVIVQVGLKNPATGQFRYFGYAAGSWQEPPSADPTIEVVLASDLPTQWTANRRNLYNDIQAVLGWTSAQITSFYVSPWDGQTGWFRDASIRQASPVDEPALARQAEVEQLSAIAKGQYKPPRMKRLEEKRAERFDTSLEECAPGRNSAANEWTAFGAIGNLDFNAMGRELWIRYPVFDLAFRLYQQEQEIQPGQLDSFRLGLVGGRMPGVVATWQYDELEYRVSAMTIPSQSLGNFDLLKLEVHNPTSQPIPSTLVAAIDGPPDIRLESGVVRGLGSSPLVVADPPTRHELSLRDWGLCDKRAKAYAVGPGPGKTEPAIGRYRLGLDGLPVVYRFKAEPGKRYLVYLASTPHIAGHLLQQPKQSGQLVFEYQVEGCTPKMLDWFDWVTTHQEPLCIRFDAARDTDGDGYIEIRSGTTAASPIKHTRLSAIYVFPENTPISGLEAVYSGSMNDKCLRHIDVGVTPEQDPNGQLYDKSDIGLARLKLAYGDSIGPGQTRTWYLRVPPVHRRQPVSMGYIAHAFRDVLTREAVPPYSDKAVEALKRANPQALEREYTDSWKRFFSQAATFDVPDPILEDIFLSRLATRAILDVNLNKEFTYNACSPFFYFDHAYRDHAYVVYAFDLAGMHQEAEKLLRVYCKDVKDVPTGPIAFDGKPLQLGMLPNGLWNTRPGQWDTQGENIWALVEHYKLSGNRDWLEKVAWPYIRRGAQWLVHSRHKHMDTVNDPNDPRYGLLEPGAMEVIEVGKGMHMYYLSAFGVLGLREAADAARALGHDDDARRFQSEADALRESLHRSFGQTFKRTDLYQGNLWFGVEPEGVGMYGFWAHNCLVWPCRAVDPHDPMLTATYRKMESMSSQWGGGMHSEGPGSFWPYIGVDRAVSYLLRGEPDRALDFFCAYTDTAGGTLSWGEGYSNLTAGGDQPHMWADAQWINLFRQLFAFEDGPSLWITPALFRRWHAGDRPFGVTGLPTHFGKLDLKIRPEAGGSTLNYTLRVTPGGDQVSRRLERILLYPRIPGGRSIQGATVDGRPMTDFGHDVVVLARPKRGQEIQVRVEADRQ